MVDNSADLLYYINMISKREQLKQQLLKERLKQEKEEARLHKKRLKMFKEVYNEKPVMYITGEEETGFDFWPYLREIYRPVASWIGKEIEKEIVDPKIWQNIQTIKNILSKYVHIVLLSEKDQFQKKNKSKSKKERKPLTEEQKEALKERLKKAREVRKNNIDKNKE